MARQKKHSKAVLPTESTKTKSSFKSLEVSKTNPMHKRFLQAAKYLPLPTEKVIVLVPEKGELIETRKPPGSFPMMINPSAELTRRTKGIALTPETSFGGKVPKSTSLTLVKPLRLPVSAPGRTIQKPKDDVYRHAMSKQKKDKIPKHTVMKQQADEYHIASKKADMIASQYNKKKTMSVEELRTKHQEMEILAKKKAASFKEASRLRSEMQKNYIGYDSKQGYLGHKESIRNYDKAVERGQDRANEHRQKELERIASEKRKEWKRAAARMQESESHLEREREELKRANKWTQAVEKQQALRRDERDSMNKWERAAEEKTVFEQKEKLRKEERDRLKKLRLPERAALK